MHSSVVNIGRYRSDTIAVRVAVRLLLIGDKVLLNVIMSAADQHLFPHLTRPDCVLTFVLVMTP